MERLFSLKMEFIGGTKMSDSNKIYGIICKIWFGRETWVFSKHGRIPKGERDYLDLMCSGEWPNVMGHDGLWIWGTPRDYMRGGKTKLLLYDKHLKAITVDADVIPDKMIVSHEGCEESDYCFPFRNVMNENTLHILDNPIGVGMIRNLPGSPNFENFNAAGDRAAFRNISKEQYDYLVRNRTIYE